MWPQRSELTSCHFLLVGGTVKVKEGSCPHSQHHAPFQHPSPHRCVILEAAVCTLLACAHVLATHMGRWLGDCTRCASTGSLWARLTGLARVTVCSAGRGFHCTWISHLLGTPPQQ